VREAARPRNVRISSALRTVLATIRDRKQGKKQMGQETEQAELRQYARHHAYMAAVFFSGCICALQYVMHNKTCDPQYVTAVISTEYTTNCVICIM
jgi:hypothetical protein